MIHRSLKFAIPPESSYNLIAYLELPLSMFLPILPRPLEYFSVCKEEHSFPVFKPVEILPLIPVTIGPYEHSKPFDETVLPLSIVLPVINISKYSIAMKVAVRELPFINAGATYIMTKTGLYSVKKLAFVV
jgi:hypothetical protein